MFDVFLNCDVSALVTAINEALEKDRLTPEQFLCNKGIIYDESCISEECYNSYSPGAVSMHPVDLTTAKGKQKPKFSLVLGSSGSGKTLFAMRRVPELFFGMKEEEYFRLHFIAEDVRALILEDKRLDFPQAVALTVCDLITSTLDEEGFEDVTVLNIPLHVTIDEAGAERYAQYFDTATKIKKIVTAIEKKATFKFQKVHVTVAGTRLEKTTAGILSGVDTIKFRMQPWTAQNFDALVDMSDNEDKKRVKEVVHGFSILENLATNARCAYFLLRWMDDVSLLAKARVDSFVKVMVSAVADFYIDQNSLRSLQNARDKWKVVRSVFLELDKSTRQPELAFFPEFNGLENERLRSIGNSLLDVNVESKDDTLVFAFGSKYACSMSPAIAIVMISLLNTDTAISWDWEAFESTVMLSELQRMVVDSQEVPSQLDKLVLVLKSPVPEAEETTSVSIPEVSRYTVMLNGPDAEYANVVAPYRLVQAKIQQGLYKSSKA